MSEFKSLLDREAQRISAEPDALEAVLRLGTRRERKSRVLTIAVAMTVGLGSIVGLLFAFGLGHSAAQPGAGGWAGTWPQSSLQDARTAQAGADANDPAYTWQLDGATVLRRYTSDQLGWSGFSFLTITPGKSGEATGYNNEPDLNNPDASGPFRFMVMGCANSAPDVTCPTATITIERLLRHDQTGIWSVVKVEERGIATGASSSSTG
jgi:hypothetical protein